MCLLLKQLCGSCERRCEMCHDEKLKRGVSVRVWYVYVYMLKVADVRKLHREEEAIGKLLVEQRVLFLCFSRWRKTGTEQDSGNVKFNVARWHIQQLLWNIFREPCDHMTASWVGGEDGYGQFWKLQTPTVNGIKRINCIFICKDPDYKETMTWMSSRRLACFSLRRLVLSLTPGAGNIHTLNISR